MRLRFSLLLCAVFATSCSDPEPTTTAASAPASASGSAPASAAAPARPPVTGPNATVAGALTAPMKDETVKLDKDGTNVDVTVKIPEGAKPGPPDDGNVWTVKGADDNHAVNVEVWLVDKDDYTSTYEQAKTVDGVKILKTDKTEDSFVIVSQTPGVVAAQCRRKVKDGIWINAMVHFFFKDVAAYAADASKWVETTCTAVTGKAG